MKNKNSTREKILKISRDLIIEKPYHTVSLNMIARKAGVTKPAFYYHFRNKEEIFLNIFDQIAEGFKKELKKTSRKELSPTPKLHLFISTYINFFFMQKDLIKILIQRVSQKNKKLCTKIEGTREEIINTLEEIMKEVLAQKKKQKNITPRLASIMLLGMLGTFYIEHIQKDKNKIDLTPDKIADQIIELLNLK